MLTTEHPIPLAEVMTMLLFSVIWKALSGRGLPVFPPPDLFSTRSSMVSGTESLMSLHRIKPSVCQLDDAHESRTLTSAFVKELHGVRGYGQDVADILIATEHLAISAT